MEVGVGAEVEFALEGAADGVVSVSDGLEADCALDLWQVSCWVLFRSGFIGRSVSCSLTMVYQVLIIKKGSRRVRNILRVAHSDRTTYTASDCCSYHHYS